HTCVVALSPARVSPWDSLRPAALLFFFPTVLAPPTPPLFPYTTLFRSLSASVVSFVSIPLFGHISDLIGRTKMYMLGAEMWPNRDRKSTRLNSSHLGISYAVFCLKKKKKYAAYCKLCGSTGVGHRRPAR